MEEGTNVVVGNSRDRILAAAADALEGRTAQGRVPEKWDGMAAERIVSWILTNTR